MKAVKALRQRGFTIVELMIATAVLSTILLLVTVLMINIGHLYYKGINQARVQSNVRTVTDEVAQQLQLGDSVTPSPSDQKGAHGEQAYCVGNKRYTYTIGIQIDTSPAWAPAAAPYRHILWRDDNPSPGSCSVTGANAVDLTSTQPSPASQNGTELVAPKSRLVSFTIIGASPYNLNVGMAYGDNDLLCSPPPGTGTVTDSCKRGSPQMTAEANFTNGKLICKDSEGNEFCATAKLDTTVVRRLP